MDTPIKQAMGWWLQPGVAERIIEATRLRPVAALGASIVGALVFFMLYYSTLGMLPATYVLMPGYHPIAAWTDRLDIAQFFGTLADPPYPTRSAWWIGISLLMSVLTGTGIGFGLLFSWAVRKVTAPLAALLGIIPFVLIASAVSLGSGYNPAVMRAALPDVGFFFLGWSGWAAIQLLACCIAFAWTWGTLYRWK